MNVLANKHQAVLLQEAVDALNVQSDGIYFDGTFGCGGHSSLIFSRLGPSGRLLATDKDPQALVVAQQKFSGNERLLIQQGSFKQMSDMARLFGRNGKLDGILLDLGLSSAQLDVAARGFSFMREGPLDMRMDPTVGESVAEWLGHAKEKDIADVLWRYGEERKSRRIARNIVRRRQQQPLVTTTQLAQCIEQAMLPGHRDGKHPATRSFQALRSYINHELDDLRDCLEQVPQVLAVGGRMVVISFHSLQDRMVKQFIRKNERGVPLPRYFPVQAETAAILCSVGKAIKASVAEIQRNVRSRSAIMRVAERCA